MRAPNVSGTGEEPMRCDLGVDATVNTAKGAAEPADFFKHPDMELEEQKNGDSTSSGSTKAGTATRESRYGSCLRPRKIANYKEKFEVSSPISSDGESSVDKSNYSYGCCVLPDSPAELRSIVDKCNADIGKLEVEFFATEHRDSNEVVVSPYPDGCIPIRTNVLSFDFAGFASYHRKLTGRNFDVVMMDPPWQLSSSNPTRGVAIAYETLADSHIQKLPVSLLQDEGFLFIWTINAKVSFCFQLMASWGYRYYDEVCWVKQSVNGKIAKGHGFYLQHSKESCLIGIKGDPLKNGKKKVIEDCIFSPRRGQSQKPGEIYEMIERLIPGGCYLEIFGRRNNLRSGWVTIGNELQQLILVS